MKFAKRTRHLGPLPRDQGVWKRLEMSHSFRKFRSKLNLYKNPDSVLCNPRARYLHEANGEDGVTPAALVVHVGHRGRSEVSRFNKI